MRFLLFSLPLISLRRTTILVHPMNAAGGRVMKKYINRTVMTDIGFEIVGNILLAAATYNVAAAQGFPLSGFNGIAMVF